MPSVQGTLAGRTNADMVWVSVKAARSCTVSTRRVTVLRMHTGHLPIMMVVRVQSQTGQLTTCLWSNLIISTQDVTRNVSSSKRGSMTWVDTIWSGVIHGKTVGMGLHNACAIKNLELTVMSVKAVMKMCFLQSLAMLARIVPNHKTNTLCIAVLFLWFNWNEFCPLFKPILCVLCIWLSYESRVSSF